MTEAWIAVAVIGAATIALKGAGTLVLGGSVLPRRFDALVTLLAPSLFAGLVVVQTLEGEDGIAIDARVAGIAAAAVALALRAPLLAVLAVSAGVAAAARALGAA